MFWTYDIEHGDTTMFRYVIMFGHVTFRLFLVPHVIYAASFRPAFALL